MHNVVDYGADPTGAADSATAIQGAIDAALSTGGRVHIPDGRYKLSRGLVLDQNDGGHDSGGRRVQLLGEGSGSSQIEFTGSGPCLMIRGNQGAGEPDARHAVRDVHLIGSGLGSVGIAADNCAFLSVADTYLSGFETAIDLTDCLSSQFERVSLRWNGLGLRARREDGSRPNALSFDHCIVSNNIYGGALFEGASGISFHGGTIEGNGSHAGQSDGYGIKLVESCVQGAVAASFFGTWFEMNKGRADVWMIQKDRPAVIGFHGTTMCRVSGSQYVTNHLFVDNGEHEVAVGALALGVRSFNDYEPTPDRAVIAATNPSALKVEAWGAQVLD